MLGSLALSFCFLIKSYIFNLSTAIVEGLGRLNMSTGLRAAVVRARPRGAVFHLHWSVVLGAPPEPAGIVVCLLVLLSGGWNELGYAHSEPPTAHVSHFPDSI